MEHDLNSDQIQNLIHCAWEENIKQNSIQSSKIISQINLFFKISNSIFSPKSTTNKMKYLSNDSIIQYLCVQSTLYRWGSQFDLSKQYFQQACLISINENLTQNFFLLHEKSQRSLINGDFTLCMENSLKMLEVTKSNIQIVLAKTLLLISMENMGMSTKNIAIEVEAALKNTKKQPLYEIFHQNLRSYNQRQLFRSGHFLWVNKNGHNQNLYGQDTYYKSWIKSLPYHLSYSKLPSKELETYCRNSLNFNIKWYRLRTILGQFNPSDMKDFKWSEYSDRIHLWTWNWLQSQDGHHLENLLNLLQIFNKNKCHQLTCEDSHMIGNTILWLGFFSSENKKSIYKIEGYIRLNNLNHFPLLQFEQLFIKYLFELKSKKFTLANTIYNQAKAHILWNSREYSLPQLWRSFIQKKKDFKGPLNRLYQGILEIITVEDHNNFIQINLKNWEIKVQGKILVTKSAYLCRALNIFSKASSLTCKDFYQQCFQCHDYDPFLHLSKIYNILSRLKKLTELKFNIKDNLIYFRSSSHLISVQGKYIETLGLQDHPYWINLVSNFLDIKRTSKLPLNLPSKAPINWQKKLSRHEIQEYLGFSRSSTLRWINQKIIEGNFTKIGNGKATRYFSQQSFRL